jgi:predicted lipoprotein with Yx(FWY)xxD motif
MKTFSPHLGRAVVAAAAMSFFVAACGDSGDDGSDAVNAGSSFVAVASVDGTDVLTDAEGHTLYTADVEQDGQIRCVDACTSFWEPVLATDTNLDAADATLKDDLAVVDRPDGKSQLTYDGLPLYTFAEEGAGELQGDGFTDDFQGTHFVWVAARADGTSNPSETSTSSDPGGGYDY